MLCESFIHLEHVDGINTKNCTQFFITEYISSIAWILQILPFNIGPQVLDNLEPV